MSKAVPSEWELSTLDDNARLITDGAHASPTTHENGKPIATVQNMRSRAIDVSSCRLISENDFDALTKGNCAPEIDDVLFSKDGTVGKTFVYRQPDKVVLLSSIAIIRLDKDELDPEFCSQFLLSPLFYHELESAKSGSAIRRLVLNDLKKVELPKPPLPEQQKIAAILSSVDDVIEKTRAQIDKLRDLKTGMMQELLTKGIGHTEFKDSPVGRIPTTWNVLPLEQLVRSDRNITYGIVQAGPHHEEGVPYIRVSDMTRRHLSLDGMLRTSPEIAQKYKRSSVSAGDIVYALRGVIGHVHVVPAELDGANLTQGTARLSPNDSVHSSYMLWAMRSPAVQLQNDLEAKGSTFKEVTLASLRKIQITLPPAEEQVKITSVLDSIERKLHGSEDKFEHLQRLKKALMQDLLTGKVRVKVDQKESAVA